MAIIKATAENTRPREKLKRSDMVTLLDYVTWAECPSEQIGRNIFNLVPCQQNSFGLIFNPHRRSQEQCQINAG
jgi:hypothetical protein